MIFMFAPYLLRADYGELKTRTRTFDNRGFTMTQRHAIGICLFCSDPRFPLWREIKKQLILPHQKFIALGILGGPISLVHKKDLTAAHDCLLQQIYFALKTFEPPNASPEEQFEFRVIGHNCGFYANVSKHFSLQDKMTDVPRICDALQNRFHRQARGWFGEYFQQDFSFEQLFGEPAIQAV